jgi:hypothetical protein
MTTDHWVRVPEAAKGEEQAEIESLIVPEVVKRHKVAILSGKMKKN